MIIAKIASPLTWVKPLPRRSWPLQLSAENVHSTSAFVGLEPGIPQLEMDDKTESERHQSKIRQQKPGGRVAQLGPSGPGGEFVRAELAALCNFLIDQSIDTRGYRAIVTFQVELEIEP